MSTSYSEKEISEWNSTDLSDWLLDNKYRGISELCQKYSLSGYDLFFITDDVLRNELGINSFHERIVTKKLIKKLTSEHLKLNIINSNGDNVILTLDNNHNTSLGDISQYIGNMFDIDPNFILYKDSTKQEVLSPTLKIIELMILYPRIYKTLNISNMKDYHQIEDKATNNENNEGVNSISKTGDTISRVADKNEENEKMRKNYEINTNMPPLTNNNNITYSFGENSRDLNSNSASNNYNMKDTNKYYQAISPNNYKPSSDVSEENHNNLMLNNNNGSIDMNANENQNQNYIKNQMVTSNNTNSYKYKSEKRIYRDKNDFYYNYNNKQNNQTEYMSNNGERNINIGTSSSNDGEDNEVDDRIKYNKRNYEDSNDIENNENISNNYEIKNNNFNNNGYKKYKRINEINKNNYYDYNNENDNNINRRKKLKRGIIDNAYKGKMYDENYNDSNPNNEYYKH